MASDETRHGADQKAASFINKLRARKAGIVPQPPSETPQNPPKASVTDEGFTIMRSHTGSNVASHTGSAPASNKPGDKPGKTARPARTPKAQPTKAKETAEENIEASIAMALEAMDPDDPAPAASAADKKLDAAIDEIIADDSAAADQKPAAIMPGSFGAVSETAGGASPAAATAATAAAAKVNTAATAAKTIEKQAATLIGSTMAQAIKSIVHDEMSQTIDLIARRAVRDAFRQA